MKVFVFSLELTSVENLEWGKAIPDSGYGLKRNAGVSLSRQECAGWPYGTKHRDSINSVPLRCVQEMMTH